MTNIGGFWRWAGWVEGPREECRVTLGEGCVFREDKLNDESQVVEQLAPVTGQS